ncbi:ABC transporter ATP-binding protein [Cellulomonas sp. WB94]|uniref:ABC transporter ATP-binding protein n=1 Tax=Cellulomonas sp. WB94 TaxID=2173174 RepID=UPI000D563FF0|nr:ABC transporter ATP-binding protein [Cellulomonas sp. WB94]PVU84038.1 ABC transporter ATP-binding protein [Cellulomonas sp. WB94]
MSTTRGASATTERDPGLRLTGVTLRLGDGDSVVTALDDVHLDVQPGELVAVVGPSGSGKSSLLAVAGTLTTPDEGTVVIDGVDLATLSAKGRARFRREHIGFVFQSGNLLPALTAIDQLRLVAHVAGRHQASRDPLELLADVGMTAKATRRPHELSGGERQRVGIARALMTKPSLLLVDEPTAALDRARSQEVVELLARETRRSGVATVMVTHDHDVLHHCDRVLEMVDGRLSR